MDPVPMKADDLTWLDAGFVEKILQKAEDDDSIKVSNITVKPATAKGDNYLSNLQRVIIEFSRNHKGNEISETLSVVVKIMLQDGTMNEVTSIQLENNRMFETEISMLSETLPKMNEILAKLQSPLLAPRCLYVQKENPIHLIMEDLVSGGFQMVTDHQIGLNMQHCLLIFRNLAVFHASSLALGEKDPKAVENYKKTLCSKDYYPSGDVYYNNSIRTLAEEASTWPNLSPRIIKKVSRLSTCLYEKAFEATKFEENDFNVLNHGDLWINNILFRYDERRVPIDLKFVDFQFSYYGSPALDILYFLGIITSEDIRMNHRELLLREYHDSLTTTIARLNCKTKAPSFENLKEILRKRKIFEVFSSVVTLPFVLVDRSQVNNFDKNLGLDGEVELQNYRGELFPKVMTEILIFYDNMGLLDS